MTIDNTDRFTGRAGAYEQYRLRYPVEDVLATLRELIGLTSKETIADVGSGTGMLSEVFLSNGNTVLAIEPNADMREMCETLIGGAEGLRILSATAEETSLDDRCVDVVAAGRAFHWFDHDHAIPEFKRILKPDGWVVLVSIGRAKKDSEASHSYEQLLLEFGTDYRYRREGYRVHEGLERFFPGGEIRKREIEGEQRITLDELIGQTMSYSMSPLPGQPGHEEMLAALGEYFVRFSVGGLLTMPTTCWINCARFAASS